VADDLAERLHHLRLVVLGLVPRGETCLVVVRRLEAARRTSHCKTPVMGVTGAHVLLYSAKPDELREALRDLFGWDHVDAGAGWLIFGLPAAELAVHPADAPHHELSFMCDDIDGTVAELRAKGAEFRSDIEERRFGKAVTLVLPGDVDVLVYEPAHPTVIGQQGRGS
jgi:catechol 2,3-dioxygenase-like lactoylglutathione lyase family enzyme